MQNKVAKAVVFFLFLLIQKGYCQTVEKNQAPVVPNPVVYKTISGDLSLADKIVVDPTLLPLNIQNYLKEYFQKFYQLKIDFQQQDALVLFKKIVNVPEDTYSINISDKVLVTYSSEQSCFYAVNTLLQLIQKNEDTYSVQKAFISDAPKFQWRGMHLDVSRHFFTVEEVKKFIDYLALYKFNKMHWHLTDDQGWRIEIKQFPKLTEIGGWRDSTVVGHANSFPNTYDKTKTGGFYTHDQIKEIVAYAKDRYITIIPEIEMPGHARAALAAYPEYSCTGLKHGVEGQWGVFDDIYCSKRESIEFNKKILDEVLQLFPSEYIHIGGDEAPKTRWKECLKCQQVIKDNKLKDEHELQSYFIKQIDEYLSSKGRKLIGWDEILEGGLSPNATVMSWRGEDGGIQSARQKHYVVMSPGSHCYFDHYQANSSTEPLAIGGYLTLEKVYSFNPVPSVLTAEEQYYVLGGQANLWTEYIPNFKHLEYMMFPRALAMSQSLWSSSKPNYTSFLDEVVNHQFLLLNKLNTNYSKAVLYPVVKLSRTVDGLGLNVSSYDKNGVYELEIVSSPCLSYCYTGLRKQQTNNDTLYFKRDDVTGNTEVTTILIHSDKLKKPLRVEINSNSTIGLPVELLTQPNQKFNNRGDLALVDGVRGVRPWRGDEWLGFDQDTVTFIVDLLKIKKINQVQLGFLTANGSWIYLPETVTLSYSRDRSKWKEKQKVKATEYLVVPLKKKARYVKVTTVTFQKIPEGMQGEGFHPWTFIDEIEINCK